MRSSTLLFYSALAVASPILDVRQSTEDVWSVTNFQAQSSFQGDMHFSLTVDDPKITNGISGADCSTYNHITNGDCANSAIPAYFAETPCGDGTWTWGLVTNSSPPDQPNLASLSLKISQYDRPGGTVLAHACKELPYNLTCIKEPDENPFDYQVTWNVPSSFDVQSISGDGSCFISTNDLV